MHACTPPTSPCLLLHSTLPVIFILDWSLEAVDRADTLPYSSASTITQCRQVLLGAAHEGLTEKLLVTRLEAVEALPPPPPPPRWAEYRKWVMLSLTILKWQASSGSWFRTEGVYKRQRIFSRQLSTI